MWEPDPDPRTGGADAAEGTAQSSLLFASRVRCAVAVHGVFKKKPTSEKRMKDIICTSPVLKNTSAAFRFALLSAISQQDRLPSELVFDAGASPGCLYIIVTGSVRVSSAGLGSTTVAGAGSAFGYLGGLGLTSSEISRAEATSECRLLAVPAEQMQVLFVEHAKDKLQLMSNAIELLKASLTRQLPKADLNLSELVDENYKVRKGLLSRLKPSVYLPGQVVTGEGKKTSRLGILLMGTVTLEAGGQAVGEIGPFAWLTGEMVAVVCRSKCPCTSRAKGDVIVGWIAVSEVQYGSTCALAENESKSAAQSPVAAEPTPAVSAPAVLVDKLSERVVEHLEGFSGTSPQAEIFQHSLFRDCSREFLEFLAGEAERYVFRKGGTIYERGRYNLPNERNPPKGRCHLKNSGSVLFLVKLGRVAILDPSAGQIGMQTQGTFFNEAAVFGGVSETRTFVAATPCEIYTILDKTMKKALENFPAQCSRFAAIAGVYSDERTAAQEILTSTAYFRDLEPAALSAVASRLTSKSFFMGQELLTQGAPGDCLILLLRGTVVVKIDGVVVTQKKGPDIFGEMAVIGDSNVRVATVQAASLCDCHILYKDDFQGVADMHPEIRDKLSDMMTDRNGDLLKLAEKAPNAVGLPKKNAALGRLRQSIAGTSPPGLGQSDSSSPWFSFFNGCSQAFLARFSSNLVRTMHSPGQNIIQEGDPDTTSLMLLQMGNAKVTVRGDTVGEIWPGNIFGEIAALGKAGQRTSTVTASSLCVVVEIAAERLLEALSEFPAERDRFEQLIDARIRSTAALSPASPAAGAPDSPSAAERRKTAVVMLDELAHKHMELDIPGATLSDSVCGEEDSDARGREHLSLPRLKACQGDVLDIQIQQWLRKKKEKEQLAPIRRDMALARAGQLSQQVPEQWSFFGMPSSEPLSARKGKQMRSASPVRIRRELLGDASGSTPRTPRPTARAYERSQRLYAAPSKLPRKDGCLDSTFDVLPPVVEPFRSR